MYLHINSFDSDTMVELLFSEPRFTTVEFELEDDAPFLLINFPLGKDLCCSKQWKAVGMNRN